jgi:hypothetical protein
VRGFVLAAFGVVFLTALPAGCGGRGSEKTTDAGPVNHAPVLCPQADTTAAVGDTLRLQAVADDQDGDSLLYGVVVRQTGEEIGDGYLVRGGMNGSTGRFWFYAQDRDRPSRRFLFTVHDHRGGADTTEFTVTVP